MKRILIIDDDKSARALYRAYLDGVEYEISEAENGAIGLNLYRRERYDLVITDIFMPEKDGITTILELLEEFPGARIAAVSGGTTRIEGQTYLESALNFGAVTVLSKPCSRDQFVRFVERGLTAKGRY